MKLTRFTDYSLRVLMHLGIRENGRVTIKEISASYGISHNHLMKVVSQLTRMGYLDARRGPGGGIELARIPSEICLADVIMDMEDDLNMLASYCSDAECIIAPVCKLKCILNEALTAYFDALRDYTLADLLKPKEKLSKMLGMDNQAI